MGTILVVNTDIAVHNREKTAWTKVNIKTRCVSSMREAISLLAVSDEFMCIIINEDNVPDFIVKLPVMRDVTDKPIIVMTSDYTVTKHSKIISLGADAYRLFGKNAKENHIALLSFLEAHKRWSSGAEKSAFVLVNGDIILSPNCRSVFVRNIKVPLTKIEFDILYLLMQNRGNVVTYEQILSSVWEYEGAEKSREVLWGAMRRLRAKLEVAPDCPEYIENERSVGYRLLNEIE